MSPRPSLLFDIDDLTKPEKGIVIPIATRGRTSLDLAASMKWGGIGIERKVNSLFGLFGGIGYDIIDKRIESRIGGTLAF